MTTDIAHSEGIVLNAITTLWFCNFEKVRHLSPKTVTASGSNGSHCCCWVGNRMLKVTASTTQFWLRFDLDPTSYSYLAGNHFTINNVATAGDGLDARRTIESIGNVYECQAASNAVPLRVAPTGGPSSAQPNIVCINDRYIAANALFEIGTNANLGVNLTNCLFTGSATNMSVGNSGASCSARHCYAERSGAPTHWTTRFTTDTGNTFIATDVSFESDGYVPTTSWLATYPAFDLVEFGHLDIVGRPLFLGGTSAAGIVKGPAERHEIKIGAILFPAVW